VSGQEVTSRRPPKLFRSEGILLKAKRRIGVPFLLVSLLWASKEKILACRATPAPSRLSGKTQTN
jgi:hypothetical protein